jgi:two-component system NtrC family sensor kinase
LIGIVCEGASAIDSLSSLENKVQSKPDGGNALAASDSAISVLLIDDQELIGETLQRMLAPEPDIDLHYCCDPRQALEKAIKQAPTVILLDLVMPHIDGLVLLRWLRLHSATRDIPIMMLSSEENPETKAQAFSQGANDYMLKPPARPELIARIRYHASAHQNYKGMKIASCAAEAHSQQLKNTLHELRRTQAQIIQTEKLAGLEQLVAGLAHEINNPVNFIYGNLDHAHACIQDLLGLIYCFQKHCPQIPPEVQQYADAIDLEFLQADLPKMLTSMKKGTDRIRQIVLSLRNFSRLDESARKRVDIHEGIDSALLILQHRLKAFHDRPEINVVRSYGTLPLVECYPAELNQVFMNVLNNAIDAIDHRRVQAFSEHAGKIVIHTTVVEDINEGPQIAIRFTDNGCGISETVKSRIFDPFFTTKPIGQGTGLGLSISYQVVVHQHRGKMKCHSTPQEGTEVWIEIPIET